MTSNLIDGKAIANQLFIEIKKRAESLPFQPLLCDVVVGNDPVSLSYVKIKEKRAQECGLAFSLVQLPDTTPQEQVIAAIEAEQEKPDLCGLIVQLPLPSYLDSKVVLNAIDEPKDVDGINPNSNHDLTPPTAGAILQILDSLPLELASQKIVILGNGELVGKPVAEAFHKRAIPYITLLSDTEDRANILKSATVIICGVGKAGILTGDEVSQDVIVIDAGTSESGGSIAGDVDFNTVAPKAKYITPSPGGVGPVTVAKLLENVVIVAEKRQPGD